MAVNVLFPYLKAPELDLSIRFILFGLVLWHLKHRMLFNAEFCLYMYIKYICDLEIHFVDNIFKRTEAHFCTQ